MGLRDILKMGGTSEKNLDELGAKMDDLLSSSAEKLLDSSVIESGRQALAKRFKEEGLEYNVAMLTAVNVGMELMLAASSEDNLRVPVLMVAKKLLAVEKGIEKVKM